MKQIKAVIFDMDGVLFDTERVSKQAWRVVEEKYGCRIDEAFLSGIRGGNLEQVRQAFITKFKDTVDFEPMWEEKRQRFRQLLEDHGVPVKKGVSELLEYLHTKGYKIALATGSGRRQTMWNLQNTGLLQCFETIVCGDEVKKSKPDPEIFRKAAEKLGLSPAQCLIIEDSLNGIRAAGDGGFRAVMVPDLTMPDEAARQKVDRVLKDLTEVILFLEEEN